MVEHRREQSYLTQRDLDRLLRILALEDRPHTDLPPAAIENYIHGRASVEEEALVESAMAASSAVREEVLALSTIARRGEEFAALQAPPTPVRRGASLRVAASTPRRPWALRRPALLASCGLLALVLLWVLGPLPPSLPKESTPLYAVSLDRRLSDEQFEPILERAPGATQPLPAARDLRDAALLSFFHAIEWRDGEFEVHAVPPAAGGQKPYDLRLVLHRGRETVPWPYHVLLPPGADQPQTAILVFPDLLLYWVGSNSWNGRAEFHQRPGQSLFLTVAYRLGEGRYGASSPIRIPPP